MIISKCVYKMKLKILIIGSSKIVEEHIKSALYNKIGLYSLNSTRKNSTNEVYLKKKFKFEKNFDDWKLALKSLKNKKNVIIFLAPRIKDNFEILKECIKYKNFIFTEKPISTNLIKLRSLKSGRKIFVGFNRLFYNSIKYLKKNIKKPTSVIVKFTEKKIDQISTNSVHIFAIIIYLFGELKVKNKHIYKSSSTLFTLSKKGVPIYFSFSKNSPELFSIDINTENKRYLLKPIEILTIYKKIKKKYINGNKRLLVPTEVPYLKIDEYSTKNFKPGFINQMKHLKKFVVKKQKIFNDISMLKNTLKLANLFTNSR